MRSRRAVVALVAGALVTSACGDEQSPTPEAYQIAFASTDVAIATEQVEVLVFDATSVAGICNDLLVRRRSNQDLGVPIARTPNVTPCELTSGVGAVQVSFGSRAFFGIGRRSGQDFVLGCTVVEVGPKSPPPLIVLDYASGTVPEAPKSNCQGLSKRCSGGC